MLGEGDAGEELIYQAVLARVKGNSDVTKQEEVALIGCIRPNYCQIEPAAMKAAFSVDEEIIQEVLDRKRDRYPSRETRAKNQAETQFLKEFASYSFKNGSAYNPPGVKKSKRQKPHDHLCFKLKMDTSKSRASISVSKKRIAKKKSTENTQPLEQQYPVSPDTLPSPLTHNDLKLTEFNSEELLQYGGCDDWLNSSFSAHNLPSSEVEIALQCPVYL